MSFEIKAANIDIELSQDIIDEITLNNVDDKFIFDFIINKDESTIYESTEILQYFLKYTNNKSYNIAKWFLIKYPYILENIGWVFRKICQNGNLESAKWLYEIKNSENKRIVNVVKKDIINALKNIEREGMEKIILWFAEIRPNNFKKVLDNYICKRLEENRGIDSLIDLCIELELYEKLEEYIPKTNKINYVFYQLILQNKISDTITDKHGNTILHTLAMDKIDMCLLDLIRLNRFDYNIKNNHGQTVLHLCACRKMQKCFFALVETGKCDYNLQDNDGQTIMHLCAERQMEYCLLSLIKTSTCNLDLKNNNGKTVLDLCVENDIDIDKCLAEINKAEECYYPEKCYCRYCREKKYFLDNIDEICMISNKYLANMFYKKNCPDIKKDS
jgi:hypothetical protein